MLELNWVELVLCVSLPLRSDGHFMHVEVNVTDVMGPLFLMLSLPGLYILMTDTSTSALP